MVKKARTSKVRTKQRVHGYMQRRGGKLIRVKGYLRKRKK